MIHWKIGVQIFVTGLAKLKMRDHAYFQHVDQCTEMIHLALECLTW